VRYAERMRARPAHQRTASDEAELIKELGL